VSVIIIGLGVVVTLPLLVLELVAQRVHCFYRVGSVVGPSGRRLVCACIDSVLSTCFEPFDQDLNTAPNHDSVRSLRGAVSFTTVPFTGGSRDDEPIDRRVDLCPGGVAIGWLCEQP
jgi:hypothetical protein